MTDILTEPVIDLKTSRVYACLECGRCTGICPVARTHNFSPRKQLSASISNGTSFATDSTIWACLTCKLCDEVCPAEISYSDINKKARHLTCSSRSVQTCTHGGLFEQITELMLRPKLDQNRLGWVTEDLNIRKKTGDTLYFTGCTPYFADYFGEGYDEKLTGALQGSVKLMNKLGIKPVVMANERCCGHDVLLRGETEKFKDLAELVTDQIKNSQAERIVFSCPECMVTIRNEYPKVVEKLGVEILHISELLSQSDKSFDFNETDEKVTFQDPCRLGRYSTIYDQPRDILNTIPGLELNEMSHSRERAICCGNTAWIGCDAGTRQMQDTRLKEAEATESNTLLTSCPKCLIHLTCSQVEHGEEKKSTINIQDTWGFITAQLK
jgi:heterodisulfide reductase subunit D